MIINYEGVFEARLAYLLRATGNKALLAFYSLIKPPWGAALFSDDSLHFEVSLLYKLDLPFRRPVVDRTSACGACDKRRHLHGAAPFPAPAYPR